MPNALMWLNLYGCQAVQIKLKKKLKKIFLCFLALFWGHIRQPDGHVDWATLVGVFCDRLKLWSTAAHISQKRALIPTRLVEGTWQ